MREIEAQAIRRNQRAGLRGMRTKYIAQRVVQQVRGSVVAHHIAAALGVDIRLELIVQRDAPRFDCAIVDDHARHRALCIGDVHAAIRPNQHAGVAHLAAAFGVEGRAVKHQLHWLASAGRAYGIAARHQRQHAPAGGIVLVAEKFRRRQLEIAPHLGLGAALELRSGAAARALLGHRPVVGWLINFQTLLGGNFLRQVERETIRVLERKRIFARQHGAARRLHLVNHPAQACYSAGQRAQELALFNIGRFKNELPP